MNWSKPAKAENGITMSNPSTIEARDGSKILIVDDNALNREFLEDFIESLGHEALVAEDGVRALEVLQQQAPDMVLLDNIMPRMNGEEVLKHMKQNEQFSELPVIMISANNEMEMVAGCIAMGADDYLTKPFNGTLLKARINACLTRKQLIDERSVYRRQLESLNSNLSSRVRAQVEEISLAQMATIFAMSKLAESRDEDTGEHLERMREYAKLLTEELQQDPEYDDVIDDRFIENIFAACPLHDIGKVGIPDRILLKPGKLTKEEFEMMKYHPSIGADTLRAVETLHPTNSFIHMGIDIAESHHEKWDGTGYPKNLAGNNIPLVGRIVALGDVYDALTTQRCYKEAFSHEKSRAIILEGKGKHFDPKVVQAFLNKENEFIQIRQNFQDTEKVLLT